MDGKKVHGNAGEGSANHNLVESEVREIRRLLKEGKVSQSQIAREYGITQGHVSNIGARRVWKHIA